jgi:hypothetical protein
MLIILKDSCFTDFKFSILMPHLKEKKIDAVEPKKLEQNSPMGCIIHVENWGRCVQANSMKLVTISTGQLCKRCKITIFYGSFHL